MSVVLSILALGVLILVHEAGHWGVARLCRMRTDVFSVGFGPALVAWRGKETEFRISALPLGGYVRIAGMAPGDGTDDDPGSFANHPSWQRFLVIAAGPVVNWVLAYLLLASLYVVGVPVPTGQPVFELTTGPAKQAGLMPGDRVLSIDGEPIGSWQQLVESTVAHRGREMALVVERGGARLSLKATPGPDGKLGVMQQSRLESYPVGESLLMAAVKTVEILGDTLGAIGKLFRRSPDVQLMGPVGIVTQTADAASRSTFVFFFILVQISLVLFLMNLLPLPGLDGGRLVFIVLAMVRRRPVNARLEAVVHGVGLLLMLGLLVYATFGDVGRHFGSRSAQGAAAGQRP